MLKKILIAVLLLVVTPIFVGCGSTTTEETQVAYEKREGVIQALGVSIYQQGTHRLEKDGNLIALLEAATPQINLDDYIGKEVTLEGKVQKTVEGNLEIMSVVAVTPKTEGGITDATVSIEKYTDPQFGFSVNYPNIFSQHQTRSGVAFSDGEDKVMEVLLLKNDDKQDLLQWLIDGYGYTADSLTKVSVAGLMGYQFQNSTGVVIYLAKDKQVFTLAWYDNDSANRARNRRYYLEFVQSFTLSGESTPTDTSSTASDPNAVFANEGEFCGGIAAIQCGIDLQCKLDGDYPDAGGTCEASSSSSSTLPKATSADQFPENTKLPQITAAELQRGWYYGDSDKKKPGTPDTWILAASGTKAAMWRRPDGAAAESTTTLQNANSTKDELSTNQSKVYDYLVKNIATIAPEKPKTGSWSIAQIAFAAPNYVYAVYVSGDQSRRLLFVYTVVGDTVSLDSQAYFVPGETSDWLTSEGKDTAYGKELIVVNASGSTTKLLENYNQYSNYTSNYQLQYPRSWYWRNTTKTKTEFSDKPFPAGLIRVVAEEVTGASFTFDSLQKESGKSVIYLYLTNSKTLKLTSESSDGGILQVMAQTFKSTNK
ncbi:MAG: hypothetical protein PHO48_04975 [Candidatus Gracilibacteria bacterium]|nr:hypothetical protein [Candidatus Gracilibacteria bacterium]MDD5179591.1 hypothetical protein [Candidatus Gracilibacteria bacterium]